MKIAIVSSGLGHVARGIETWADDLSTDLFHRGLNVTLFKGGGEARRSYEWVIHCARRDHRVARWLLRLAPRCGWRFGLGSAYQIEQTTFALLLISKLRAGRHDVVHTQDPWVAYLLERARRRGSHRAAVILAHGTEEPFEFLQQFDYVQELAPYYLAQDQASGLNGKNWFAIPNFVDVDRFAPNVTPLARRDLGVPEEAFVVLTVSAIKCTHKRLDQIIDEVARLRALCPTRPIHLIVAGAREKETDGVIAHGRNLLGQAVTFLENFDRNHMPALYRCADVLAHGSLNEMMPIALLEATASGLPVVAHNWPVIEWIVGDGGDCVDTQESGAFTSALTAYFSPVYRAEKSAKARQRAVKLFSQEVIVSQILDMYRNVLSGSALRQSTNKV